MGTIFKQYTPFRTLTLLVATSACVATRPSAPTATHIRSAPASEAYATTGCLGYQLSGSATGKEQVLCSALKDLGSQYQIAKGILRMPNRMAEHGLTELLQDAQQNNIIDGDRTLSTVELQALEKTAKYIWQTARERNEAERTYVRSA